ncbi:hypothetical protein [Streptomyces zingiberis]|uniref:Uncharacterized protein n=1 Tax=Streptomyces zingiberis TaxID=2053010 RepID=A0ABX1BTR0_9ACTN|nr:hypothetical protein [Streptomyces zingiberis]NJQ01095.1 hypothetical protein [Streptomyces zingiberis]
MAAFLIADGDSGADGPRPLTTEETNRLAITRFRNHQARGRSVTITVPGTDGGLTVTASVDYRRGNGYGVVHGTGRARAGDGLIRWTPTTVYLHPMADAPAHAPTAPPRSGWYDRPLLSSGSALDTSLSIALGLGGDRPDNAALLPQNGAAWWGRDRVGGHQVDVMTGPSSPDRSGTAGNVRYWVGSDGTMYRVRVQVGSEPEPVVIDFDTHPYVPAGPVPGTTPGR